MDINQQQHLANFAPKQSLDKYSKGADPRVISGIVALSEMQEQAAMRQRANLASGAASGQMPTVRDKIMSLFQQSNPQQAQMQPNPMQQGIAARAHPNLQTAPMPEKYAQEAPQEAPEEMYSGGVARLPVRDDMFGYAGGGIIAFNSRGSVPKADDELPSDEAEGSRKRMKQRTDMTPEKMDVTDLDFTSLPQLEKSDLRQKAMAEIPKGEPETESEMMRAVKAPFRALGEGIKSLYKGAPGEPVPIGMNQNLAAEIAKAAEKRPAKAPAAAPATAGLAGLREQEYANVGTNAAPPAQISKPPAAPAPGAKPPVTAAPVKAPAATTAEQDQEAKMMDLLMKQFGPQPAVETTEQRLAARDKYIEKAPTAPEALALLKHYDNMAKRYAANDQEEKAQQAINARNNLWTFLSNTRGSSLGVAAGKANAALQPLLSAQETRRQTYQKQRDEQEMLLGKARYEIANAERARKEGRYTDAEKSESEAKKLQEQARGHNIQGLGSLINAAGSRAERRADREQRAQQFQVQMAANAEARAARIEQAQSQLESQDFQRRMALYNQQTKKLEEERQKQAARLAIPNLDPKIKESTQARLDEIDRELDSKLNWALTGKTGTASSAPSRAPTGRVIDFNAIK